MERVRSFLPRFGMLLPLLLLLLAGCGGDDSEPVAWDGYLPGPDVGSGWVAIYEPWGAFPDGRVVTSADSLLVEGHSFVSPTASCPALTGDLGAGYAVTWSNAGNGSSGVAHAELNCFLWVFAWWRIDDGIIPLAPGDNPVTVTAVDAEGNIGRASIVVERQPPPP